jgi:hypothetical protein
MTPPPGLVAERKARLRLIAQRMTDQGREGDLSAMADEHRELTPLRQRANGESLD